MLSKLTLFAATMSLWCAVAAVAPAEEEQGGQTEEESEQQPPAREVRNFFPNQSSTAQPSASESSAPSNVAGETERTDEDQHLGVGKFSQFPVHVSLSVFGGYDDNVITTSANGHGSAYVSPNAELNYKFGDSRTDGSLRLNAGVTYYFDRAPEPTPTPTPQISPAPTPTANPSTQDYDVNVSLGASIVHKATTRLTIGGALYLAYQTQPDFSANVGTNRRTGNYFYSSDRAILNYAWFPRFATASSYNLSIVRYDDSSFGEFQDRLEHLLGTEFRFLYTKQTTLFADLRFQAVNYEHTSTSDSVTGLWLVGFEHIFNPRFSFAARGGWQYRKFENDHIRREPYFESTLSYAAGKRTSLSWTNYYRLEEPSNAGSQSKTTFRTGLQAKHGFTKRISATVGLYYVHDDYEEGPPLFPGFPIPGAPAFVEDTLDFSLGVRYEINRDLAIDVGYQHTEVTSDIAGREYSRNRYFGGLNFTF